MSRKNRLGDHSREGKHCQPAVLEFCELLLLELLSILWCESHSELEVSWSPFTLHGCNNSGNANYSFEHADPEEKLEHWALDKSVVCINRRNSLEHVSWHLHKLCSHKSHGGKHTHTAMLQLSLTVPRDQLWVLFCETERVEVVRLAWPEATLSTNYTKITLHHCCITKLYDEYNA